MARAHDVFDPIAAAHFARPDVDMGRMFGTEGLRVRGKVYAFVAHEGDLIVKVSQSRADELAATGEAARMVMRGRELREWVTVPVGDSARWADLIDEAHAFVDEITP